MVWAERLRRPETQRPASVSRQHKAAFKTSLAIRAPRMAPDVLAAQLETSVLRPGMKSCVTSNAADAAEKEAMITGSSFRQAEPRLAPRPGFGDHLTTDEGAPGTTLSPSPPGSERRPLSLAGERWGRRTLTSQASPV